MSVAVSSLLFRVRDLVNQHRDWFEALAAWYDSAKWSKRVFTDYLAARNKPVGRATLSVNEQSGDDRFRDRKASETMPLWWVPASALKRGDNHIDIWLKQTGKAPMSFDGITVEQVADLSEKTKGDHRPKPKSSPQASAALCLGAGYRSQSDRWTAQVNDQNLRFTLHLAEDVPHGFCIGISVKLPTIGYSLVLEDIWDHVADAVKDKIKKLIKDYYRRLEARDPEASVIQQQIRDLEGYLELHNTHLARMLSLDEDATLQQAIESSGKLSSVNPSQIPVVEPVPVVKPVPTVTPVPPPLPTSPPPTPVAAPPAAGSSGCLILFVIIGVLAVTTTVMAGSAWYVGLLNADRIPWLAELIHGNRADMPAEARKRELEDLLQARGAKTGDVQVSLHWANKNDLDLEVVAPGGERVFFGNRRSKSGGELDIDMNINYEVATNKAIENISWPKGAAPKGKYQVYVNHFTNHGKADCQDPTRFTVRTMVHGKTEWFTGEVIREDAQKRRAFVGEFEVK